MVGEREGLLVLGKVLLASANLLAASVLGAGVPVGLSYFVSETRADALTARNTNTPRAAFVTYSTIASTTKHHGSR